MDLVTLALAKSYIDKKINEEGIVTGATPQQAAQIEQNKTDIAALQTEIGGKQPTGDYVKFVNGIGPNESGNVEIPAGVDVSGAQVGQTIVVKSVDESGKPTEWEAVNKPVYIANVRVDRDRYSFIDGNYEILLNAYNSGATVGLNVNDYMYYLFKVYDDNLHFGQIPYTDNDSEIAEIPNYYLMVAPDNSITQTRRDIATVGFVREAIQSIPVGGGGANWNQNDPEAPDYVKNRTHWEENNQTVIEWDGDRNGHEVVTIAEDTIYMVRVSDLTPAIADVIGGTVVLHDNNNPGEHLEEILTEDNVLPGDNGCFIVGNMVIVITDAPVAIDGITVNSNGVYFIDSLDGTVKSLTYGSTVVHPLDEKFIPESIARKTDIPKLDATLTQPGQAADAKAVGDALDELEAKIPEGGGTDDYTALNNKPSINGVPLEGDKTADELGIGRPSDEQIGAAVGDWLDEHPEATTTVADKSITPGKTDFLEIRTAAKPEELTWESVGHNMIANVGYLDIRGVKTITVVHTGAALRDVALALYTESQTQIQGFTVVSSTENQQIHYSDSGVSTNVTTLDIPALVGDTNAAFARIRVHQTTTNADSLFVYLGDPNAEPGFCWADKYGPPKLPDGAITLRHTDFFVTTGHNLIDTSRFEVTGYSGELYEQFGANIYVFGYIDVSERKNFYVRAYVGATGELSGIKIGCYDEDKNFINADGSLVTATKLRSYHDIVVENNQVVSGGYTLVYRYEVDDSVSFVRFAAKVMNNTGNIAPTQLKYVVSSYEDILDMTSPPEQYWRGISDEWRDAIRAADDTTPKTMVMIGDSLTNWGGGGDGTDGFLWIVHDKTGVVTTNEGQAGAWWQLMPGETADDISTNGVGRVNAIIRDGRKYDLYCFMLGTNAGASTDTGETSADPSTLPGAMRYCLEKLKAYDPTGQILVCLPPQRAEGNDLQEKTNEVIAKIAAEYAVPTLDIYHRSGIVPNTKIPGIGYLQDGLHLAEPGCTALGNLLAAEVKYLLCL